MNNDKIKINGNNVLFLIDYCRRDDRNACNNETRLLSEMIVDFKYDYSYYSKDAYERLKDKLIDALEDIAQYYNTTDKIVLVAAPSSTIENDNTSPLKRVIKQISEQTAFEDGSNILKRTVDVNSSAKATKENGKRNDVQTLKSTASCTRTLFRNRVYILIDDITTTGNSMIAYKSLLEESGAVNIICFAFGASLNNNESQARHRYGLRDYFKDNPKKTILGTYKINRELGGIEIYHDIHLCDFEHEALVEMGWRKKSNADYYYIGKNKPEYRECESYAFKYFVEG